MDITKRIDAVTIIPDERFRNGSIQQPPKSVKIEITARCNLRCKYCAVRTRKKQPTEDMDFDLFKRITEDMRISGVEEIGVFYLGESFMAPDLLVACIRWCKQELEFPYVFLTSNAAMATPDAIERVMAAELDSLKWSVNCASVEQFMEITGGSEAQFERTFTNIERAYTIRALGGYKTILSASSILYEGKQQELMQDVLEKRVKPYVDKHYWLPLYQMSMYRKKIETELGFTPTAGNMGRIDESTWKPNRRPLPCWSVFTEGHVRVDGNMSACCFGADERFDMGLLDGTNFMRTWNNEAFRKIRQAQFNTLVAGNDALKGTICEVCVAYEQS